MGRAIVQRVDGCKNQIHGSLGFAFRFEILFGAEDLFSVLPFHGAVGGGHVFAPTPYELAVNELDRTLLIPPPSQGIFSIPLVRLTRRKFYQFWAGFRLDPF